MRAFVVGIVMAAIASLPLASGALAAEASPAPSHAVASPTQSPAAGEAMPYADYLAALQAFTRNDPFAGLSDPPTVAEIEAAVEVLLANAKVEGERLAAVVPEPCYADAHRELTAYWQSSIELYEGILPQVAAMESLEELGPVIGSLDTELYARHPIAYVERTDGSGGFQGSPFNILDALVTCDPTAGATTDASAAPGSGSSPTP
jgi:hypothetical protein